METSVVLRQKQALSDAQKEMAWDTNSVESAIRCLDLPTDDAKTGDGHGARSCVDGAKAAQLWRQFKVIKVEGHGIGAPSV